MCKRRWSSRRRVVGEQGTIQDTVSPRLRLRVLATEDEMHYMYLASTRAPTTASYDRREGHWRTLGLESSFRFSALATLGGQPAFTQQQQSMSVAARSLWLERQVSHHASGILANPVVHVAAHRSRVSGNRGWAGPGERRDATPGPIQCLALPLLCLTRRRGSSRALAVETVRTVPCRPLHVLATPRLGHCWKPNVQREHLMHENEWRQASSGQAKFLRSSLTPAILPNLHQGFPSRVPWQPSVRQTKL